MSCKLEVRGGLEFAAEPRPAPPPSPPRAPGPEGGRAEFPSAGAPVSPASRHGSFCLRRERGNGKGGEEAGVCCAAPGPVQSPGVRGAQRSGLPAAGPRPPARRSPPGLPRARLPQAGHPPHTQPELPAAARNPQVTGLEVP